MDLRIKILLVAGVLFVFGASAAGGLNTERDRANTAEIDRLKILCASGTRPDSALESPSAFIESAIIGTTSFNCGAAYKNGLLFYDTEDGRALAYDSRTGKRVWETSIVNPKLGGSTFSAPIAWKALILIGNTGADSTGVKGRMYALDAKTGKIVWEFLLVPKAEGVFPWFSRCNVAGPNRRAQHIRRSDDGWRAPDDVQTRPDHAGTLRPRR